MLRLLCCCFLAEDWLIGCLLLVSWSENSDCKATGRRDLNTSTLQKRLDYLNNVTTIIVFITTVLNFFISTFGMQRTGHFPWLMMRIH
ncbi:hypothetical protein VZT92_016371 [Zoarces viviparus]|uniref:Ninjurin 2 n=1 Tax=Zoarces viviparus TaxID=48416 RepID=A0AAW1ETG5_ZOAVI